MSPSGRAESHVDRWLIIEGGGTYAAPNFVRWLTLIILAAACFSRLVRRWLKQRAPGGGDAPGRPAQPHLAVDDQTRPSTSPNCSGAGVVIIELNTPGGSINLMNNARPADPRQPACR